MCCILDLCLLRSWPRICTSLRPGPARPGAAPRKFTVKTRIVFAPRHGRRACRDTPCAECSHFENLEIKTGGGALSFPVRVWVGESSVYITVENRRHSCQKTKAPGRGVQSRGRLILDDFSIICLVQSNISNNANFAPVIIDIQAEKVAANAAQLLIALLEDRPVDNSHILIPPKLIIGQNEP
jgi:hypothetical protein